MKTSYTMKYSLQGTFERPSDSSPDWLSLTNNIILKQSKNTQFKPSSSTSGMRHCSKFGIISYSFHYICTQPCFSWQSLAYFNYSNVGSIIRTFWHYWDTQTRHVGQSLRAISVVSVNGLLRACPFINNVRYETPPLSDTAVWSGRCGVLKVATSIWALRLERAEHEWEEGEVKWITKYLFFWTMFLWCIRFFFWVQWEVRWDREYQPKSIRHILNNIKWHGNQSESELVTCQNSEKTRPTPDVNQGFVW